MNTVDYQENISKFSRKKKINKLNTSHNIKKLKQKLDNPNRKNQINLNITINSDCHTENKPSSRNQSTLPSIHNSKNNKTNYNSSTSDNSKVEKRSSRRYSQSKINLPDVKNIHNLDNVNIEEFKENSKLRYDIINDKIKNKFNFDKSILEMNQLETKNSISKLIFLKDKMNEDGEISMRKYLRLISLLNLNIPKEESEALFKQCDKTQSLTLNQEEMNLLITKLSKISYPEQTKLFFRLFNLIDSGSTGFISVEQIYSFCNLMGFDMSTTKFMSIKEALGDRADFCSFLGMFDFTNAAMIQYEYKEDQQNWTPVNTKENLDKCDREKKQREENTNVDMKEIREVIVKKHIENEIGARLKKKSKNGDFLDSELKQLSISWKNSF